MHLLAVQRPHHPAEPGEAGADHEYPQEQPPDAIAERFHHLAVFHAGPDQEADLGAVQNQLNAAKHDQPDQHRQYAVFGNRDVANDQGPAQRCRQRQRNDLRPPQRIQRLFGDDQSAGRHQDLLEVLAIDRQDQHPLDHQSQRAGHRHRQDSGRCQDGEICQQRFGLYPRRQRQQHQGGDIGADRDEGAVAEIEHVHQAEHQRQSGSHDENHHSHGEACDRQRHPRTSRSDQRQHDQGDNCRQQHWQKISLRFGQRC